MTVYHCSSIQGLKTLHPNQSTHGKSWLYATIDISMSAVFLSGTGGDFTCCVGRDPITSIPYICERFEGAFKFRYSNVIGSIYLLDGGNFKAGLTHWEEELVSDTVETVQEEISITDSYSFLLDLELKNKLLIVRYPSKIDGIPDNDKDLIERALLWYKGNENKIINQLENYHPNLVSTFKKRLKMIDSN